jgi:putative nucleotidyltransferase with HDIG domain
VIEQIKKQVQKECSDPSFKHNSWYWEYHILPVARIALDLAEKYKADKEVIELAAYLHDIAKIRGLDNHADEGAKIAAQILTKHPKKELIVECIAKHNKPSESDRIEVKILASADGAAHFLSPFHEIFFWENPDKPVKQIMEGNLKKAQKDWEKILLPEAQEMARTQYTNMKQRYL